MKNKLKIAITVCVVIAVVLVVVLVVVNNQGNKNATNTAITNNINKIIEETPIATSRKMSKYIDLLKDDYYMKYSAPTEDASGNVIDMTVEFAISGDRMVMNYEETLTTILITKEASYYILHENKIIQKSSIDEQSQQGFSGFQRVYSQAFFEKNFRGTGTENIKGVEYYYEEYSANTGDNSKIRYYFDEDDQLKFIKNITTSGNSLTEVLEFRDTVDESLFELPEGYTVYDLNDLSNWNEIYSQ